MKGKFAVALKLADTEEGRQLQPEATERIDASHASGGIMRIEHILHVHAQPGTLWHLLTDTEEMKHWMPDVVDQEIVSGEASHVGCTSRVQIREGSKIDSSCVF